MGFRRWVYDVLSRGQVEELDPEEPIPVAVVNAPDGPMLVSALQTTGLHAVGRPFVRAVRFIGVAAMAADQVEVVVPRREVEAAEQVLRDLRCDRPGTYIDWVLDRRTDEVGGPRPSEGQDETNGERP